MSGYRNPTRSDPYYLNPRRHDLRSSSTRRLDAAKDELDKLTTLQLITLTLVLLLAVSYSRSFIRLCRSFVVDPTGTVEGLIEMVGFKVTSLTAQLSQTKTNWAQPEQSESDRDPDKPIRRYKDLALPTVEPGAFYPGLLNAAGNLCFLNATLQAMSSTPSLVSHLKTLEQLSELTSVPVPVTTSLLLTLSSLNTPGARPRSLRPIELAQALAGASDRNRRLMGSADQQDAHELWVMIREAVEDECARVEKARKTSGAQGLASLLGLGMGNKLGAVARRASEKDPYLHLMSQRVKCLVCGYTRDVRHTVEELVGVIVPPVSVCSLAELLDEYTKMELISEYACRACSLRATHAKLVAQRDRLAAPPAASSDPPPPVASTSSNPRVASKNAFELPEGAKLPPAPPTPGKNSAARKDRRRKVQKLVDRVQAVMDAGDWEKELGDEVKVERVAGPAGKQVRFARTPDILTFHLNRSSHYGRGGAFKNSARVNFPELLDLSAFSDHPAPPGAELNAAAAPRELYRLSSLVEHYGSHSFGHYVAYRRKPTSTTPSSNGAAAPSRTSTPQPPPSETDADADVDLPQAGPSSIPYTLAPQPEWLHISDETVSSAHLNDALRANPFLIFYERVKVSDLGVFAPNAEGELEAVVDEVEGERPMTRVVQSWSLGDASQPIEVSSGDAAT